MVRFPFCQKISRFFREIASFKLCRVTFLYCRPRPLGQPVTLHKVSQKTEQARAAAAQVARTRCYKALARSLNSCCVSCTARILIWDFVSWESPSPRDGRAKRTEKLPKAESSLKKISTRDHELAESNLKGKASLVVGVLPSSSPSRTDRRPQGSPCSRRQSTRSKTSSSRDWTRITM